jgi:hypothetical protein
MNYHRAEAGTQIELIAISSGSATCKDLNAAFEEKKDREACDRRALDRLNSRRGGGIATEVHIGGEVYIDMCLSTVREPDLDGGVNGFENNPKWWDEKYYDRAQSHSEDEIIHFYNVLWIERKGNLAFRKAVGRVLKSAWDEHCSGPVDIVLA